MKKYKFSLVVVGALLMVWITFFVVQESQFMIKANVSKGEFDEAVGKFEDSRVFDEIYEELKNSGYPKIGVATMYSSLEDVKLHITLPDSEFSEVIKGDIKLIVYSVAKQNGLNPHTFEFQFGPEEVNASK